MTMFPGRRRRAMHDDAALRAAQILGNDRAPKPRSLRHQLDMEAAVKHGQPPFAHALHTTLTIVTAGLWAPVYWLAWLMSSRRRYQKGREAQLRAEGLL